MFRFLGLILICGMWADLALAQSFPVSIFDSLPLQKSDANPSATIQDRNFAMQMALSPRYHSFALLMPSQYQLASSLMVPAVQSWIDSAITRILKTKNGQHLCSVASNGEAQKIQTVFGLSERTASALSRNCTPQQAARLPIRRERPREYIFVRTFDADPPLEGWTTASNVTFIFMKPDEINEKFLLRVLIHELATQLDLKEQWGYYGDLDSAADVVGVSYQGQRHAAVRYAIRHPLLKYALSALRAQTIEDRILFELGLLEAMPAPSTRECADEVTEMIPALTRVSSLMRTESMINQLQISSLIRNEDLLRAVQQVASGQAPPDFNLFNALEILKSEKVLDLDSNQEMQLCDYLKIPKLGTFSFSAMMGGPRPRVKPWDKEAEVLKEGSPLRNPKTAQQLENLLRDPRGLSQTVRDQELRKILKTETSSEPDLRKKLEQERTRED